MLPCLSTVVAQHLHQRAIWLTEYFLKFIPGYICMYMFAVRVRVCECVCVCVLGM